MFVQKGRALGQYLSLWVNHNTLVLVIGQNTRPRHFLTNHRAQQRRTIANSRYY